LHRVRGEAVECPTIEEIKLKVDVVDETRQGRIAAQIISI
jgi:hypothetical protein